MPGAVSATTVSASASDGKLAGKGKGRRTMKRDPYSSDEDDAPLGKTPAVNGKMNGKAPPKKRVKKEESEGSLFSEGSEPEKPTKRKRASKANGKGKKDSDSDDDRPTVSKPSKKAKSEPISEGDSSRSKPRKRATKVGNVTPEAPTSPKKKGKKEEDEDEDVYKWWEQEDPNGDGSIKWSTLEHNGVFFPPLYEPLPTDVKMKYDGMIHGYPRRGICMLKVL